MGGRCISPGYDKSQTDHLDVTNRLQVCEAVGTLYNAGLCFFSPSQQAEQLHEHDSTCTGCVCAGLCERVRERVRQLQVGIENGQPRKVQVKGYTRTIYYLSWIVTGIKMLIKNVLNCHPQTCDM